MQVVGLTNEQEVVVIDAARPFRINEYLIIEDAALGCPTGEVVETQSFNRFLDLNLEKGVVGPEIWRALLSSTQYDISQHDVHVATVRLLHRVQTPIRPGTAVREPTFAEVESYLIQGHPDRSMILGVIHATDNLEPGMPNHLQDRLKLLADGKVTNQNGVPFIFDPRAMQQYPHIGIFGGSGSGKSFGLRVFLEELMKLRIPTIVLDPHFELTFNDTPAEAPPGYRDIRFEDRFKVFQVGQDVGVHFQHLTTRDLIRLLDASSGLSEGMTNAVEALHRANDSYLSFSSRIENLVAALESGEKGVERRQRDPGASGSEREVGLDQARVLNEARGVPLSSVKGIQWRLNRLYRAGLFTNDIKPIETALQGGSLRWCRGQSGC